MSTKKSNVTKIENGDNPYAKKKLLAWISRIITVIVSLSVVYPLIFILLVSFKNNNEFYSDIWGLPKIWRWANYSYAWINGSIGSYALNSIIVTIFAVVVSVILAAFAGYSLSKMHIPKAELIIAVLMCFNFIPGVAIYIALYTQMISMHLNKTLWMLIFPYMAWQIPFGIYIFKKFFDSIPSELLEAARVDGSGEMRIFLRVILPIVRPAIATVVVFNFINIWGEYMWASIASSSSRAIQTLPVGLLYFRGEYGIEWGPFAAAITIIVIPLMILFIYLQKYFIQGLTSGAMKG
ncbi:MAG TPA: carbohydrate ABC transporter permease [Mobilitalea sp.]|nr:carbohydrate ABC transporter permease [Mobilitalea sp.]